MSDAEMMMKEFKGCFLSLKKNMEYISIHKKDNQELEVMSIKRLNIAKGKLASIALAISNPSSALPGNQCSVVSIDKNLEVQNRLVSIGNKGGFSVSVKNTGPVPVRLPAGGLWGYAKLIPDIELELPAAKAASDEELISSRNQNNDDSGPDDDIDKYLNSSGDEEEIEDEKEEVKVKRTRASLISVKSVSSNSDTLNSKAVVTFCEPKEVITSLDDYKKRMNIFDQESCITGTSIPEIIKTSATNEFMTEPKEESLDKTFDTVKDFLIDTDIDSITEETKVDKQEKQIARLTVTAVPEPKYVHREYKKISNFKEKKLVANDPLLPQLISLAKLLEPISICEDLGEHFPGLFGQNHLAPVCETLVKYAKFHESSISFELSDFGDKLVCELSTIAQTDLLSLKAALSEINSNYPNATLQDWIKYFADSFENFQDINDLLGDEFDVNAVQIILLHFVPELNINNRNEEDPLTVLDLFEVPILLRKNLTITTRSEFIENENITEGRILELFDINKLREKIFIGVKTRSDDKIMIIDNDRPVFVKLQNVFQQSLLSHVDDEDIYLISVSDLLSPQCELAVSLSSWNLGTSGLFKTGFILYQSSSCEYKVALSEEGEMTTISMNRNEMKMLDDSEQRISLKPGTEISLIMKSSTKVLMGLINSDGNYWDILETTNLKLNSNEIENAVKKSVTFDIVSYENSRKFLLMTSSNRKAIFDAQRAVLKLSQIQQPKRIKKYSVTLAATLQTSKRELFTLRHVLILSGTNIKLLRNLIKVEGDNEEKVQTASEAIAFNLRKNRKNVINSSKDFKEYSLGKNIFIQENETQQLELQLKAGVSMQEYDAHVHFDFQCFSENIKPTITQTSDNCIKLQLCNASLKTVEIPAEQNIILLARKDIGQSSL